MPWLSLVPAVGLPVRAAPRDRMLLAPLRESISGLESRRISWEQFERQQPRSRIPEWQRL